jgi:60 kDa SS-A/Ro ribonucleoprotein
MQSIGNDPSLATIIKLTHTNPETLEHDALFKYLLGKEYNYDALPEIVQAFEDFKLCLKHGEKAEVPKLPFQMLTSLPLKSSHWEKIALDMSWNTLRMNLNTILRHGVNDANVIAKLANKLRDPDEVRRNNVFPYQLLTTYLNTTDIPARLRNALQDAAEIATENTPEFGDGSVAIALDVSGSMRNALTGDRGSVTTKTRCVDVAAMFATCVLRKNENSIVLPFDDKIYTPDINPRDSIMTNSAKLAGIGGGGTFCQLPLAKLNEMNWKGNLVVYFSDNEALSAYSGNGNSATRNWLRTYGSLSNGKNLLNQDHTLIAGEWDRFKRRNPKAKLVLIDVAPYETTQVPNSKDVLNIAGWSDTVWKRIADFARGEELDFAKVIKDHFSESLAESKKVIPTGLDATDLD